MATKKIVDPFAAAKAAATPKVEKAVKPAKEITFVPMGASLEMVAACASLEENIKAVKETYMAQVKSDALDEFVKQGVALGDRPKNFKGAYGRAEAGLEMKVRTSTSILTEAEAEALKGAGVEVKPVEVSPEAYLFNPAIISDPFLRAKLIKALASVDFGGIDPVIYTPAVTKLVASEAMIEKVFGSFKGTKTALKATKLVSMVTTLAVVKPKWKGTKADAYSILAKDLMAAQKAEA